MIGAAPSGAALFCQYVNLSILYLAQEQRMPGHRLPGIPPRPRLDEFLHPCRVMLPSSHLNQRSDNSPYHIPQEPVSTYTEVPIIRFLRFARNDRGVADRIEGRGVRLPESFGDGAEGGFVRAADLFEAREIVLAQEVLAGLVHGVEVEAGIAALPGVGRHERVFFPVDEVGIGTLRRAESGVEIIGRRKDRMDRDSAGQDGI